jgi:hypothetical protein
MAESLLFPERPEVRQKMDQAIRQNKAVSDHMQG